MLGYRIVAAEAYPCQLHSVWKSCNLNKMAAGLEPRKQYKLLSIPDSHIVVPNVAFPQLPGCVLLDPKKGQTDGVYMNQRLPSHLANMHPITYSFMNEPQNPLSRTFAVKTTPNVPSGSGQKQFLIFDRSGDETRFISSGYPMVQNQITQHKAAGDVYNVYAENVEVKKVSLMKFTEQEKVDENHIFGEESEMHEDTEEINALLYSDSSDDDHDESDDEVMSTGHSPLKLLGYYDEHGQISEVASFDCSNKRRKLLNGGHKNSSFLDTASSVKMAKSSNYDDDMESCCALPKIPGKEMDSLFSAWEKKVKIRETLNILEKIVPELRSKDPLLIIDGAIDYLKSLKQKAETLELFHPQEQTSFSK